MTAPGPDLVLSELNQEPVEDRPPGWLGRENALTAKPVQAELHTGCRAFTEQDVNLEPRECGICVAQGLQDTAALRICPPDTSAPPSHRAHNSERR